MADQNPNPNPNPNPDDKNGGGNGDGGEPKDGKTFTQAQLDEVVSKRINEERKKSEETIAKKIEEASKEAERKAKLTADEKAEEERKQREAKTAERETELALRENRIEARELLQSKKISSDLVDFVVDVDLEKTKTNIDTLEKAFTKAVQTGVDEKLAGKAPEDFSNGGGNGGGGNGDGGVVVKNGQTAF